MPIDRASLCLRYAGVLKILLVFLVVMFLICSGIAVYVYWNFRSMTATAMTRVVSVAVEETNLPEDQKSAIKTTVEQLSRDFRDGRVSYSQLMDVIQRLTEGPFLSLITTEIVRSEYRKGTADNEDNQQNNNLTIDRFERGLVEGLIPQQEINAALKNTQETDPQGNTKTKDHLTEKDIRAFLADIKLAADKAGIPSEPFKADFAAELRKAVDLAMGRSGRPPGSLPATSQP